ncbi:MAG: ABC transporter ATP-binding protein [Erysipelotrichaceae bacterium]|nr:ABC transporter ATP-binding protein [Erysipelotrichaceae bacterium]MBQ1287417.1 ABC transporter ATP-binding protein [Erysipelotrichaceae bacterium]MBQ1323876.1 ABC transporter ATP-binding protein [Erysipelotrichaceae bacterium]MBQ1346708.1 ABC transporter ATP-binding protein [Erysipelotrichaceae bacterium]MBQ1380292.1 ABC transporter ATP-binding protein [Erysipelotrichaceae bacterium]
MALLEVNNLVTTFKTDAGDVQAVRGVSFKLEPKEALGIVGESGSGKSQMMYSIIGLLAENGKVESGDVTFDGVDISQKNFKTKRDYDDFMRKIRGNSMAMIFQDPMTFLNPVLKVETQLIEPMLNHTNMSREEAKKRAIELMNLVGIPSPEKRITQYPFEFSGGMRQRIIIAIALANNPKLIIADEPTTALDVTIQAQVLELIEDLKNKSDSAIIMITHDLGVVAKLCDRIAIMYGGKIVEIGTDRDIFYDPKHPYTEGLLKCISNPENDDEKDLTPIPGSPPDLLNPPKGCPFVDRCEKAMKVCKDFQPPVTDIKEGHQCACWLLDERAVKK